MLHWKLANMQAGSQTCQSSMASRQLWPISLEGAHRVAMASMGAPERLQSNTRTNSAGVATTSGSQLTECMPSWNLKWKRGAWSPPPGQPLFNWSFQATQTKIHKASPQSADENKPLRFGEWLLRGIRFRTPKMRYMQQGCSLRINKSHGYVNECFGQAGNEIYSPSPQPAYKKWG